MCQLTNRKLSCCKQACQQEGIGSIPQFHGAAWGACETAWWNCARQAENSAAHSDFGSQKRWSHRTHLQGRIKASFSLHWQKIAIQELHKWSTIWPDCDNIQLWISLLSLLFADGLQKARYSVPKLTRISWFMKVHDYIWSDKIQAKPVLQRCTLNKLACNPSRCWALVSRIHLQGVAKNFREVFAELAPGGRGELVMQKAANQPAPSEQAEDDSQPPPLYERYSGVKVKVYTEFKEVLPYNFWEEL